MLNNTRTLERSVPIDELFESQQLSELPERTALSLVNANLALPINAAIAANVLSDGSVAGAGALQQAPINQGMMGSSPLTGF
jgi:hypothetical protein